MEENRVFKRKIYSKLLEWKQEENGKKALLVNGARRVGKSTIVEEFARNEYKSYMLIDFSKASAEVKSLFNDLMDLDYIFLRLQTLYHVVLENRQSVIIFDEVQECPMARQAIYPTFSLLLPRTVQLMIKFQLALLEQSFQHRLLHLELSPPIYFPPFDDNIHFSFRKLHSSLRS